MDYRDQENQPQAIANINRIFDVTKALRSIDDPESIYPPVSELDEKATRANYLIFVNTAIQRHAEQYLYHPQVINATSVTESIEDIALRKGAVQYFIYSALSVSRVPIIAEGIAVYDDKEVPAAESYVLSRLKNESGELHPLLDITSGAVIDAIKNIYTVNGIFLSRRPGSQ
jgi:hypothetical protein